MDVERAMILLISGDESGKLEYAKGYGIAPDVQDSLRKRAYHFDVNAFTREDFSRVSPLPCTAPVMRHAASGSFSTRYRG